MLTRGDPRIGGSGYLVATEPGLVMPAGYVSRASRFTVEGHEDVYVGCVDQGAEPTRCYRVSDEDMAVIVAHRPKVVDPTVGTPWTAVSVALHVSLQALRFARFGAQAFGDQMLALFEEHLHGLHTRDHHPDLPYKPHSDVSPLGGNYMALARDATIDVHPTPRDMRPKGHVVNVRSLFGDADLWRHLQRYYPVVFTRGVDALLAIPKAMSLRGVYSKAVGDPVAIVRDYFPEAYAVISAARPDFETHTKQALVVC